MHRSGQYICEGQLRLVANVDHGCYLSLQLSCALARGLEGDLSAFRGAFRILEDHEVGLAVGARGLSVEVEDGLAEVGIVLDLDGETDRLAVVVVGDDGGDAARLAGRPLKNSQKKVFNDLKKKIITERHFKKRLLWAKLFMITITG